MSSRQRQADRRVDARPRPALLGEDFATTWHPLGGHVDLEGASGAKADALYQLLVASIGGAEAHQRLPDRSTPPCEVPAVIEIHVLRSQTKRHLWRRTATALAAIALAALGSAG